MMGDVKRAPRLALILPALFPLVLGSCAPTQTNAARSPHLNPLGEAPDVVILAVSGRCTQPCRAPRDNYDYLTSRGTLDLLADMVAAQGFRVQVAGYGDNAQAEYQPLKVTEPQRGYAALQSDFTQMKQQWFMGPRPPRLILLGHSHGSVWLHHLIRNNPGVPVALQIDLDSNCTSWKLDHGASLRSLNLNETYPALNTCDPFRVMPMNKAMLNKDIAWPNVARNLEVQSKRLPSRTGPSGGSWINYAFEITRNVRPDGSRQGIEQLISTREDHSHVTYPNSDAVRWVLGRVKEIAQEWKAQDRADQP